MKKTIFFLLLASSLGGCSLLLPSTMNQSQEVTVQQATDAAVTVKDKNGKDVHLADYKGKKLYINVWASWCGPCMREIPELEEVYQLYKDKEDYVFLSLTSPNDALFGNNQPQDKTAKEILAVAKEKGITYPVLFDSKDQAATHFALRAFPTHIFVNSDGTINKQFPGQIQKDLLIEQLESLH